MLLRTLVNAEVEVKILLLVAGKFALLVLFRGTKKLVVVTMLALRAVAAQAYRYLRRHTHCGRCLPQGRTVPRFRHPRRHSWRDDLGGCGSQGWRQHA